MTKICVETRKKNLRAPPPRQFCHGFLLFKQYLLQHLL